MKKKDLGPLYCHLQEKDLAAAAEKLAECQETIFLLGKQLNILRPQAESSPSPYHQNGGNEIRGEEEEEEPTTSDMSSRDLNQAEMEPPRVGGESPSHLYNSPMSPSDTEGNILRSPGHSKHPKHRSTNSGSSSSSSSSSNPTPEKHARSFTRFFSSKGKDGN
jgi:hypothetical protein